MNGQGHVESKDKLITKIFGSLLNFHYNFQGKRQNNKTFFQIVKNFLANNKKILSNNIKNSSQ